MQKGYFLSRELLGLLGLAIVSLVFTSSTAFAALEPQAEVVVSVRDQKMALLRGGALVTKFPISTSRFGLGDSRGSYKTPLGRLRICEKIGDDLALGAVMKGRAATGEILPVNAKGRDPIVSRIMWLEGLEEQNRNAKARAIYIHGTPEEKNIGEAVSYGCVRMRSKDVISLYEQLEVGAFVTVIEGKLPRYKRYEAPKPEPIKPEVLIVSNNKPATPSAATTPTKGATDNKPAAAESAPPEKEQTASAATPKLARMTFPVGADRTSDEPRPGSPSSPHIAKTHVASAKTPTTFESVRWTGAGSTDHLRTLNESILDSGLSKMPGAPVQTAAN